MLRKYFNFIVFHLNNSIGSPTHLFYVKPYLSFSHSLTYLKLILNSECYRITYLLMKTKKNILIHQYLLKKNISYAKTLKTKIWFMHSNNNNDKQQHRNLQFPISVGSAWREASTWICIIIRNYVITIKFKCNFSSSFPLSLPTTNHLDIQQ